MNTFLLTLLLTLGATRAAEAPRLPEVLTPVSAPWPKAALDRAQPGEVLLEVGVDARGRVTDAIVLESSDPLFEAPAIDALQGYTFAPARDAAGQPTPARIQYRYRFTLDAVPERRVEGRVEGPGGPEPFISVEAEGPDGARRFSTTDADGAFAFADLSQGIWRLFTTVGELRSEGRGRGLRGPDRPGAARPGPPRVERYSRF